MKQMSGLPGFRVVEPIMLGAPAGSVAVQAKHWCNIVQDDPDAVDLDPETLNAYCTKNGYYFDGVSGTLKCVIQFESPLLANTNYLVVPTENKTGVSGGGVTCEALYDDTGGSGGGTPEGDVVNLSSHMTMQTRTRYIIEPFEIEEMTWNTFQADSPAMEVGAVVVQSSECGIIRNNSEIGNRVLYHLFYGQMPPIKILRLTGSEYEIYGLVIDVSCNVQGYRSGVGVYQENPLSVYVQYSAAVVSDFNFDPGICAVPVVARAV